MFFTNKPDNTEKLNNTTTKSETNNNTTLNYSIFHTIFALCMIFLCFYKGNATVFEFLLACCCPYIYFVYFCIYHMDNLKKKN